MSRINIPYSPLPDDSRRILLPLVPVIIFNNPHEFSTVALVDSGASRAVISTVIAEKLGIKWEDIPVEWGNSVSDEFRFHRYNLKVEIYENTFPLSVSIIEGVSSFKCILGQADLFQRAKITFERYKNQFSLEFRKLN